MKIEKIFFICTFISLIGMVFLASYLIFLNLEYYFFIRPQNLEKWESICGWIEEKTEAKDITYINKRIDEFKFCILTRMLI